MAQVDLNVADIQSKATFDAALREGVPVVCHFWAPWCEPCKHMDVVLRQLSAENGHAKFVRVEAEEVPEISEEYDVASVPLFLFFKNGKLVDRLEGANAPELAHKVAVHISGPNATPGSSSGVGATASPAQIINTLQASLGANPSSAPNGFPVPHEPLPLANGAAKASELSPALRAKLEALVRSKPVVLFMKGTPEEPRCGFSSKVVAVLKALGFPYGSFDILADEEVRQGLKLFSEWPTFPQLYAAGELVGGSDIVLEMQRSGELRKVLEKAVKEAGATEKGAKPEASADVQERLKALVSSSTTLLFMKGSPDAPQCGYSRRVVEALQDEGIEFGHFNILADEAVRQNLKAFSQWPTYPQLYHKGEFIGGCDIVMELKKSGELKATLQA